MFINIKTEQRNVEYTSWSVLISPVLFRVKKTRDVIQNYIIFVCILLIQECVSFSDFENTEYNAVTFCSTRCQHLLLVNVVCYFSWKHFCVLILQIYTLTRSYVKCLKLAQCKCELKFLFFVVAISVVFIMYRRRICVIWYVFSFLFQRTQLYQTISALIKM